jgi:hypothetical protein
MSSTVRTVHLCEPKQHVLQSPLTRSTLLNPVPGNSEVCIGVVGLPHVAGETDFTYHSGALVCERQ